MRYRAALAASWLIVCGACGAGEASDDSSSPGGGSGSPNGDGSQPKGGSTPGDPTTTAPPAPSCDAAGGSADVGAPALVRKLKDDGGQAWLASPAIVDLDGDGASEVVVARGGKVYAWNKDGSRRFVFDTGKDRIWASPVIGKFGNAQAIGVAARDSAWLVDASGKAMPGFPVGWGSETRTLAAGDLDGDGVLDLAVGVRNDGDILRAYRADGSVVSGFPPVASGSAGCTPGPCYFAGLYDQNLAIGDLDGDGKHDLVAPHDNAYASFFHGSGVAFDSNAMFRKKTKTPGVRYLHTLSQAQQGFADDEDAEDQAHFTNTPPAIADVDADGHPDIVMLGSVQNASQENRLRGVGLWLVRPDASRLPGWETPFHVPAYVLGLADGFARELDGDAISGASNLVGATNQVTVADLNPNKKGLEMVFSGFDGRIHAVGADKSELWATPYATNGRALTGGVLVADLSADGVPEIVFTTYSPDQGGGALFILDSRGKQLHKVALPKRGAMPVPAVGDVDGDGTLEIVVSLKDQEPASESVLVFNVPSGRPNCLLWPTGRANLLRNGWIR